MITNTYFVVQKGTKSQNKQIGVQENCTELLSSHRCLEHSGFQNNLYSVVKGKCSAQGIEKSKILGNLMATNMDDHGGTKIQNVVDLKAYEGLWICMNCPFLHKTILHCAERKAKLLDN